MMKKISFAVLFSALIFSACERDYDNEITVAYPINEVYTMLDVSNAFDVVMCDTVSEAMITVAGGNHKNVIFKVKDRTLTIDFKFSLFDWFDGHKTVLLPSNPDLCDVELSGASTFKGNLRSNKIDVELSGASAFVGSLNGTEQIELDLSGASSFKGDMQCRLLDADLSGASKIESGVNVDKMEIEASGSSKLSLSGSCLDQMIVDLSGSSTLSAPMLECQTVTGKLSGASDADVACCKSLSVSLSGASSLVYGILSGCTPEVHCPTTGGSTVTRR